MTLTSGFIQQVEAQETNEISYPSIPYEPPDTVAESTPTPQSSIPVEAGPIISLEFENENNIFDLGSTGTLNITIDTKGNTIQSYTVLLEYDSSHIEIIDSDINLAGTQIEYIDTFFEEDLNQVETGILGSENNLDGLITLIGSSPTEEGTSFSDRVVARIDFRVVARDTSEVIITDESTLISDQTNILDTINLQTVTINSGTEVIPTSDSTSIPPNTTNVVNPTTGVVVTNIPKTSSSGAQGFIFVLIGLALTLAGVILRRLNKKERQ